MTKSAVQRSTTTQQLHRLGEDHKNVLVGGTVCRRSVAFCAGGSRVHTAKLSGCALLLLREPLKQARSSDGHRTALLTSKKTRSGTKNCQVQRVPVQLRYYMKYSQRRQHRIKHLGNGSRIASSPSRVDRPPPLLAASCTANMHYQTIKKRQSLN